MGNAHSRKVQTERQKLLGHLLDHHRPPNAAVLRWTVAQLEEWHRAEHERPREHSHDDTA